ncbi:hypothetical protein GJU40_04875 [Bacillus lacus]|uniref:HPr family phosphocarrier protein n=1 Tax=Metabacillus lacus TaxID=1983721 RepID=A0A7X2IX94_9BACI|nr:hypothetical protein [Metabacillus lacus]MRX71508.1 hypothetical protein [Metabacillus lacus]
MNNKMLTSTFQIQKRLRMEQIIQLNELAQNYKGKIYFITGKKNVVDASKLPSLIAFLLTLGHNYELKALIDGEQTDDVLEKMEAVCSLKERKQYKAFSLQQAVKVKV